MRTLFLIIASITIGFIPGVGYSQSDAGTESSYLNLIINHYNKRLQKGKDTYGAASTPFWMASVNTTTGMYPEDDTRPDDRPERLYQNRPVEAPRGSTIYWDMPQVVMAYYLSEKTGNDLYAAAADAYIQAFLANCVAKNSRFLWGNHYYYDVYRDSTVRFGSTGVISNVNFDKEIGDNHELRPLAPSWEAFWRIDPEATEQEIRSAVDGHLLDPNTGEYDRHASGVGDGGEHAFLESGGVLVHMLAWLYQKNQDVTLLEKANKIANYNFSNRNEETQLLENSPNYNRWDKIYSTTEVGLWARDLIAASEYVDATTRQQWVNMADIAMTAWLKYGFDPERCRYYGILRVENGEPIFDEDYQADFPDPDDGTVYRPDNYTSLWEPLFPRHDYPMPFAESCLELYKITGKDQYKAACYRWLTAIQNDLPAWDGEGGYADLYGRVIHFLLGGHETFHDERFRLLAQKVGKEAVSRLYADGMFRTHTGEDRYDVADMFGFLASSLIWLETGEEPDMMGIFY
ncbi:MAG: hypothetical protein RIG62_03375 [Cyclobacteriaceae bacterium]